MRPYLSNETEKLVCSRLTFFLSLWSMLFDMFFRQVKEEVMAGLLKETEKLQRELDVLSSAVAICSADPSSYKLPSSLRHVLSSPASGGVISLVAGKEIMHPIGQLTD